MTATQFLAFFWITILFLAQNAVTTFVSLQAPIFLIVGVIFYGLYEGPFFGFIVGCFAGVFMEFFGVGGMGYPITALGLVGLFSGLLSSKIFRDSFFTKVFLSLGGIYFFSLMGVLFFAQGFSNILKGFQEHLSFSQFFYYFIWTILLAPFVFKWLKKYSLIRQGR